MGWTNTACGRAKANNSTAKASPSRILSQALPAGAGREVERADRCDHHLRQADHPQRIGHRHRVHTPAQLFETGDNRYIALSAATDDQFRKLTEVLGIERECADPRFTTKSQRKKNEDELLKVLEPAIRKFSAKELEQKIVGVGIPCSPVNDYAQVFEDEHVKARGLVVEVNHPQLGRMKTVRNPVLMDKDGPDIRRAAPSHGQHTAEILGELGYDGRRIEALANAGTVKLADTGAATLKAAHA